MKARKFTHYFSYEAVERDHLHPGLLKAVRNLFVYNTVMVSISEPSNPDQDFIVTAYWGGQDVSETAETERKRRKR